VNEASTHRAPVPPSGGLPAIARAAIAALLIALAAIGAAGPAGPAARAAAISAGRASAVSAARHELGIARRLRLAAWNYALRQRGKPYIWGGVGPRGFDCSGLVWAAYRSVGIVLPRTTQEMLASKDFIRITWRQARRGDLAFFGSDHVELFRYGYWTLGAAHTGTRVGFHPINRAWHPTAYFRVR
jgi:cell wall-associated NlpC family hydrolase